MVMTYPSGSGFGVLILPDGDSDSSSEWVEHLSKTAEPIVSFLVFSMLLFLVAWAILMLTDRELYYTGNLRQVSAIGFFIAAVAAFVAAAIVAVVL